MFIKKRGLGTEREIDREVTFKVPREEIILWLLFLLLTLGRRPATFSNLVSARP